MTIRFWEQRKLTEFTKDEWEQVCDGCARCCLVKLEDDETGEVYYTDLHCRRLDAGTCRCTVYAERRALVPACIELSPERTADLWMMPASCAYRRLAEGRGLPDWHHLVSGDNSTVLSANRSIRGRSICEDALGGEEDEEDRLVDWPVIERD